VIEHSAVPDAVSVLTNPPLLSEEPVVTADILAATTTDPKQAVPVNREHYFGACPNCGNAEAYLNVVRDHWSVCHTHKTKWWTGFNLFSSWEDEDESVWAKNVQTLKGYTEVEPLRMIEDDREGG
jgi:hypothetical protein